MRPEEESLYDLLGLSQSAGTDEITLAFRWAAKRWHPDLNAASVEEATERMKHIAVAYEVLRDPDRRAAYDRDLRSEHVSYATTEATSDTRRRASTAPAEPMNSDPDSLSARVIEDPRPPLGYRASPPWYSSLAALVSRGQRFARAASSDGLNGPGLRCEAVGVLCLSACPFVAFLLAAWIARSDRLARWGALYVLAAGLWATGAAMTSPLIRCSGMLLFLAGVLHGICWQRELHAAILAKGREHR
jgi:hypothetical protein